MNNPVVGRSCPQRATRGFTIVELLVAIAILSMGLMTLVGTFTLIVKIGGQAKDYTIAVNLAEEKLEDLRSEGFSDLVIGSTEEPTTELRGGTIKSTITAVTGQDKLKQVEVKVYWDNRPESQAIQMSTLVAQRTLANQAAATPEESVIE